jgi:predicted DNA-binding transcriptional regulator AlpA
VITWLACRSIADTILMSFPAASASVAKRRVQALSVREVLALLASVDVPTAGSAFGIGRSGAYALARSGEFPCPVLKLGGKRVVTRSSILAALGIEEPSADRTAA